MGHQIRALALTCIALTSAHAAGTQSPPVQRGYSLPLLDLADQEKRQVVVDREPGQYLGHPTTVLLEDGETILTAYPKGQGKGAIVLKRSTDGGLTWSDRPPCRRTGPPRRRRPRSTPIGPISVRGGIVP